MLLISHNTLNFLKVVFTELEGYQLQGFYPSYFGARERLQKELGCRVSDILVLAFLALEDVHTTAYALNRLKEVKLIEKGA